MHNFWQPRHHIKPYHLACTDDAGPTCPGLSLRERANDVVFFFCGRRQDACVEMSAPGPSWLVRGTKKGALPIAVEKRPCGKKVTLVSNVTNPEALIHELKRRLGTGGTVARNGDAELQGDQVPYACMHACNDPFLAMTFPTFFCPGRHRHPVPASS